MTTIFRRIKHMYEMYNILHYARLKYLTPLYQKYEINKRFFQSLCSEDLPKNSSVDSPWLDTIDSAVVLPTTPAALRLSPEIRSALSEWSSNGFAILKGFFSEEKVGSINELLTELMQDKRMTVKENRKIMHAVRYSEEMKNLASPDSLTAILELLMGTPVELFQSVNFLQGSEDPAHSDFIHMSTYPYGYLLAVWIALEDIDETNGPIFYYPGSHKLSYVMNPDFNHGGNRWLLGKDSKKAYAKAIEEVINNNPLEKQIFTASKGDVIIWHANLLHGGQKVLDPSRTRKSMVLHYFGTDVIRYHEITQRPSLKP